MDDIDEQQDMEDDLSDYSNEYSDMEEDENTRCTFYNHICALRWMACVRLPPDAELPDYLLPYHARVLSQCNEGAKYIEPDSLWHNKYNFTIYTVKSCFVYRSMMLHVDASNSDEDYLQELFCNFADSLYTSGNYELTYMEECVISYMNNIRHTKGVRLMQRVMKAGLYRFPPSWCSKLILDSVGRDVIYTSGADAMFLAAGNGLVDYVSEKLTSGAATVTMTVFVSCNNFYLSANYGYDDVKFAVGGTLLHMAACSGDVSMIKLLIEKGANINAKNIYGTTPLHAASIRNRVEAIRVLVELGADVVVKNNGSETPLHSASFCNNVEAIRVLVELGADVNAKDGNGGTPLQSASLSNHVEAIRVLVELGADVNTRNLGGDETPLHTASHIPHVEAIRVLVELGADVNAKNGNGETPLHKAAIFNRVKIIRLLVELGADVNAKNNDGETPLVHLRRISDSSCYFDIAIQVLVELGEAK
jgi:hypothetical protein